MMDDGCRLQLTFLHWLYKFQSVLFMQAIIGPIVVFKINFDMFNEFLPLICSDLFKPSQANLSTSVKYKAIQFLTCA
jgi:hypothetical protein